MIEFSLWFIFITFSFIVILYLFLHFSNKQDRANNLLGFAVLSLVFMHLLIIFMLMFQDTSLHSDLIPLWFFTLGFPILVLMIVVLISSLLGFIIKFLIKSRSFKRFNIKIEVKFKEKSKAKNDLYRKVPHVLMFIGIFILWLIGVYVIYSTIGTIEGMIPYENNMLYLYLQILTMPNIIRNVLFSLGWFYYLLFFFFYIFALIMLINEFTRKSRYLSFPSNIFCTIFLNKNEKESYGTYLYFSVGHMFAALICPPMVFFSILGVSTIADLFASQIGIRYGKNHIKFNQNKTWEGTIAGSIAAFLVSFLFIGHIWALLFSFTFLLLDILTEKPLKVSDNLIFPIALSIIYFIIRFVFNLNYYTLIG
ncbi:MAG: hypothetical protein ACFFKA_20550 [Candidatus Thorarchaeota archaeon]